MNLKEKLININLCIDNNYLDIYVKIINNNLNKNKSELTQKHHIIPQYYFKYNNIDIDNTSDNLVNLDIKDHIYAHYCLALCSKNDDYKNKNIYALTRMIGKNLDNYDISKSEEYQKLYLSYKEINKNRHLGKHYTMSQETKDKISISNKNNNKGKIYIHNDNIEKRIYKYEFIYYEKLGYKIGRSEKTKESLSKNYNYNSKGMLNKKQSDYQKKRVFESNKGKKHKEESKLKMSQSKKDGNFICLRDINNTHTIRIKEENLYKYINNGYYICNNKNN